ncbi:hypothetical protein DYB30_002560 [Aphanomyces astaci]|uniref:EF-hand domain-containing protein n=1 Tax=Aphanomyces astaci TaxID=112090 RepID=A0A397DQ83_APHAT|nr:hypothetical protein DYB38_001693 [Aphanomyces astaci]RHY68346.1 hypothetical protein DYB30_002560 [Aphanomyces astaci]
MEILSDLYLTNPDTDEINLQGANLRSLDVELPLLKQFRELRHLNVSHNQLTELPVELAELSRLVALDVSSNLLGSLHRVLPVLQQLPSLKSLGITLADPSTEEPLILAALPKLRILNAMPLLASSLSSSADDHVQNVASILHVLKGIGIAVPPGSEEDQRVSQIPPEVHCPDLHTTAAVLLAKFKIVAACSSYATQKAGECAPELGLACQTLSLLQQDIVSALFALTRQLLIAPPAPSPHPPSSSPSTQPAMDSTQIKQLLEVAEGLEADVQRGAAALANEQRNSARLEAEIRKVRKDLAAAKAAADLIEAIYASKRKYDQMNADANTPKETMEQHMYTYLNQRFGLHALIVEYASAIMKGCARYGTVDCDVATFLHLVRNEVDEGYLRLKQKLEDTVVALLRAFLRGLHPRKSEGTITQLVHAKLTSATTLTRDEWQSIVTYMYDTQDTQDEIAVVIQQVDPHEHDCITFTDAVEALFKDIRTLHQKGLASSTGSGGRAHGQPPPPPPPLALSFDH